MTSEKRVGRLVGLLILLQAAAGIVASFALLRPALSAPEGYLAAAAESAWQVRVAVLLWIGTGVATVAIAIAAWPVFRRHSRTLALWLLALGVASLTLLAVEGVAILSMLSLSQEYARAGAADGLFEVVGEAVRSARYWAHYTGLLVGDGGLAVFYVLLYRFSLIPRALTGVALVALALQLTGVVLPPLLGYRGVLLLVAPLGLTHLAAGAWLTAKGFRPGS